MAVSTGRFSGRAVGFRTWNPALPLRLLLAAGRDHVGEAGVRLLGRRAPCGAKPAPGEVRVGPAPRARGGRRGRRVVLARRPHACGLGRGDAGAGALFGVRGRLSGCGARAGWARGRRLWVAGSRPPPASPGLGQRRRGSVRRGLLLFCSNRRRTVPTSWNPSSLFSLS